MASVLLLGNLLKVPKIYWANLNFAALELVVNCLRKRMQSVGFEFNEITAVLNKGYILLAKVGLL